MIKRVLYILTVVFGITGCISNDLPYPSVVPNVISLDVEGADQVVVDCDARTVSVYFQEDVDLRTVTINAVELDSDLAKTSIDLIGVHDLTSPLKFNIRTYQDYVWTIVAVKNIEYSFSVVGQVGSSIFDEKNFRAVATVGKNVDIANVTVSSLKLGPAGVTTYSVAHTEMKDFTHGLTVDVTAFDETHTWTLYVAVSEVSVEITDVDPWAREAYVTSAGVAEQENGFYYRQKGTDEWTTVEEADITSDGGTFVAHIKGLRSQTKYEVMAYSGNEKSGIVEFETEAERRLPNGGFEYVSKVTGADYYKFYDPSCGVEDCMTMFWGSGNGEGPDGVNGSANLGIVITYVDTEEKVEGNQSVLAQTSQMVGMLAAGNLFTGQFAGLVGTSGGKVNFGRPWDTRPKALKLHCKYSTGKMDIINGSPQGVTLSKDDYDRAQIKVALGTWNYRNYGGTPESPVHVNTTDSKTFVDFSKDPSTIADGNLIIHHNGWIMNSDGMVEDQTNEWHEYIIPLNYHTLGEKPTHIIISCAASQFGDYFTGYSNSKLWIDAVELIY